MAGTYALDTGQPIEKRRLDEQALLFDPLTFRQFDRVGVAEGWRCLEVGAGAGSVASWLCRRVGPTGHVVATDLETRWLHELAAPNLEVRRHDVVVDPLEESAYELVHTRLLLTHLPQRDAVMKKLVAALRPGGWLVVEEPDAHSFGISHPPHGTWAKVANAMLGALTSAGADTSYGRELPAALLAAGLTDVSADGSLPMRLAPDLASSVVLPVLERLRERILTLGLATATEIESIVDELRDPSSSLWIYPPIFISARGRRDGPGAMSQRSSPFDIQFLPAAVASDDGLVGELTDLVNRVYATAEAGLWVDGATRTSTGEMAQMIAEGEIAVARLDGRIVGSVRVQELESGEGEFGMLVADPARRSEGIGRELVTFAEEWIRQRGRAVMQLELLVPREWTHPTKEFLDAWYTRLGYRPVRSGTIDESYPQLAPLLATPCDFVVYHKDLTSPG